MSSCAAARATCRARPAHGVPSRWARVLRLSLSFGALHFSAPADRVGAHAPLDRWKGSGCRDPWGLPAPVSSGRSESHEYISSCFMICTGPGRTSGLEAISNSKYGEYLIGQDGDAD